MIPANEYCKKIFDGTHDSPKPAETGYPLVTSKHILDSTLNYADAYLISDDDYQAINKRSKVSQWDILFSMIGTVGEIYLEKNSEINYAVKNLGVFSCNDEKRAKWLYYFLQSPIAKKHIQRYLNGAVQKFLPLGALREFPVIPYQEEKYPLINLMDVIDRKIALNNQINAELEKMAKTLYDYWFVQFDFPDENGKPYKSSGGKMVWNEVLKRDVPLGWIVEKIKDIAKTGSGGTPKSTISEYYENGNIPWINSGELNNSFIVSTENFISKLGMENSSAKLFPENSILMAMYGATAGKTSILGFEATTNQAICAIMPFNENLTFYLKIALSDLYEYLINLSSGSARDNLSQDKIKDLYVTIPNNEIIEKYANITNVFLAKIKANLKQTQLLTQYRDFLLPMLMNGQVEIL